jgi:hypothetical protein
MATVAYEGGGLVIPVAPSSRTFAARLRESMREFEKQLKDTENVRIIAMIGSKAFSVEHIAIRGSEMAIIDGPADEAQRYRILCHVNALQLMLRVEAKAPNEKRRRIGFLWEDDADTPEAASPGEPKPPGDGQAPAAHHK